MANSQEKGKCVIFWYSFNLPVTHALAVVLFGPTVWAIHLWIANDAGWKKVKYFWKGTSTGKVNVQVVNISKINVFLNITQAKFTMLFGLYNSK